MEQESGNEFSSLERETHLWEASKQYMLGEIDVVQLESTEDHYSLPHFGLAEGHTTHHEGAHRISSVGIIHNIREFLVDLFS